MKRVCLNIIYTFLLFSYVSPVFGSQMTLGGKLPDQDELLKNGGVSLSWNNAGTYKKTQNGNVTWQLENGRRFCSFCNGEITQKWSDGSSFSKKVNGNIEIQIPKIGTYTLNCNGSEKRNGLQPEQISYIKENGCLFDNENLNSYILPPRLLSNSKYSISSENTQPQNVQSQQQNIQLSQNNNTTQNSTQVIDSRFDRPTASQETERDRRIAQNDKIKVKVDGAKRGKIFSFVGQTGGFYQNAQKKNVLFLDACCAENNSSSTLNFMGKVGWLAAAVGYDTSFVSIKNFILGNITNLDYFKGCDENFSAEKCWDYIKNQKRDHKDEYSILGNIVCLNCHELTSECEYVDLFFHIKKLIESDNYAFVLYIKNNNFTIQSYVVKCTENKVSKIAIVSDKQADDKCKNFIDSLFNEDSLQQQIAESEMKNTKNWTCSREILERLGIKEDILKKVEEAEKEKASKSVVEVKKEPVQPIKTYTDPVQKSEKWNERIARIWSSLKQSYPQLATVLETAGPLLVLICAYYLLSGMFASSSVPSSNISIVNPFPFDENSIPTMPWFRFNM